MSTIKILVPLDGTEKSMGSLDWLVKYFKKENTVVTLLTVAQVIYTSEYEMIAIKSELEVADLAAKVILDEAEKRLDGYEVNKLIGHGSITEKILQEAVEGSYDLIVMTKSSVKGFSRIFGSVASKVVRDSEVAVVIIP